MAFKIKSAKIFFFGIKEHTVMLLSVVLSYSRRPGRYRTSTGRGNEALSFLHPASGDRLLTKVALGRTAVRHLEEAWPREGEREFSHRKTLNVSLMVRLQSELPCKLVLGACPRPRAGVCVLTV